MTDAANICVDRCVAAVMAAGDALMPACRTGKVPIKVVAAAATDVSIVTSVCVVGGQAAV